MKYLILIFAFLIVFMPNIKKEEKIYMYVYKEKITIPKQKEKPKQEKINVAIMTSYGPDCYGCSGISASGVDVRNTIYYEDKTYGKVHVVAADNTIPFGSIISFSNVTGFDDFLAIVLDRGSQIGFNKSSQFDLLLESETISNSFGRQKINYSIIRNGY